MAIVYIGVSHMLVALGFILGAMLAIPAWRLGYRAGESACMTMMQRRHKAIERLSDRQRDFIKNIGDMTSTESS